MFLLTGNTRDYASGSYPVLLPEFLERLLCADFGCVAFYNRATGLSFPLRRATDVNPGHEDEFLKRAGMAVAPATLGQTGPSAASSNRLPQEPMRFFPAADRVLRYGPPEDPDAEPQPPFRPSALVIEYADTLFPSSPVLSPEERNSLIFVQRWALDPRVSKANAMIILVGQASSDINQALRAASSKVEHIEVPMPDEAVRLDFVLQMERAGDPPLRLGDGMSVQEFAAKSAGLTLLHMEDIKLRAGDGEVTQSFVRERKDEIIKSEVGEILASDDPDWGLDDVGGLTEVKTWLDSNIIRPLKQGKRNRVPLGVLLVGPPGTGKTYLVKALAHDAGVNYRELDFGRLLGGIVGTSERNLENVLRVLEASAPCIVFTDEIDQALRRGTSGLNPVQDNLFGRMLRWLSEPAHRGRIVVIAATNRPDLLDAALKRAGRFDVKIPILPPGLSGRRDALSKLLRRYSPNSPSCEAEIDGIATRTDGWTPAELELVVVKAVRIAGDNDRDVIAAEDLVQAAQTVSPSTTDTRYMTDLAIVECNDRSLLPPEYRSRLDNRAQLEADIDQATPALRRARRGFGDSPDLS
ncbi:MAG: ATP-binding protein [Chloroflexota bacterium]